MYYVIRGRRSLYLLFLLLVIGTTFWFSFYSDSAGVATTEENDEQEAVQVLAGGVQRTVSELDQNVVVTVAPVPTKFAEYRIEREKIRSKQIDLLEEMLSESNLGSENRERLQAELLTLNSNIAKETEIENLLKTNGYVDAVVLIEGDSATVVVPVTLNQAEAGNIGQLVNRITDIRLERITIIDELSATG